MTERDTTRSWQLGWRHELPPFRQHNPAHWRRRAEQAFELAARQNSQAARKTMVRIGNLYGGFAGDPPILEQEDFATTVAGLEARLSKIVAAVQAAARPSLLGWLLCQWRRWRERASC